MALSEINTFIVSAIQHNFISNIHDHPSLNFTDKLHSIVLYCILDSAYPVLVCVLRV